MEHPREAESETAAALLEAAERCLRRHGMGGLSTRKVAEEAGMPLSQIHYHFASKRGLLLALLEHQDRKLLARQEAAFSEPRPLWERWMQACDYLEEDLASGYVRVLHELIAAGWADEQIAAAVRRTHVGWYRVIERLTREAEALAPGILGPLTPTEAATAIGNQFLGAEVIILMGFSEETIPARTTLRKLGEAIRGLEAEAGRRRTRGSEATGP